jgi:hypothetical protein
MSSVFFLHAMISLTNAVVTLDSFVSLFTSISLLCLFFVQFSVIHMKKKPRKWCLCWRYEDETKHFNYAAKIISVCAREDESSFRQARFPCFRCSARNTPAFMGGGRTYVEFIKHEARFSSLRILRQFLKLYRIFSFYVLVSCRPSDSPQIPLCRRLLGLNPGLLRLWH